MSNPTPTTRAVSPQVLQLSTADRLVLANEVADIVFARLAGNSNPVNTVGMNNQNTILNKEQYFQLLITIVVAVVGTVLGVMAIVVPLSSEKSDAQFNSVMTEIGSLKNDIKSMGENLKDHQAMYERVIDERTADRTPQKK